MESALLIIDVQKGFDQPVWGTTRNNPDMEANIARLLDEWRSKSAPIIHVKHNSTEPNSPLAPTANGNEIKDIVKPLPTEVLFEKSVNSAFIGTGLKDHLDTEGIKSLVVVGLTTDHCVSTTVRMAANLGFHVCLVNDATATFGKSHGDTLYSAQQVHEVHLASLNEEFCAVIDTSEALNRSTSDH